MEKIGLLLDSTTLTRKEIKQFPFVKVADLIVTIDGTSYEEKDIPTEVMIKHLHEGKKMSTSQPAPGRFLELYEQFYHEGYTSILVITLSDKISGTYQSAVLAKSMLDVPLNIEIMAARVASFGVAVGILPIAKRITEGKVFSEIVLAARTLYADAEVLFTLNDLMHLFRGGRLSKVSALIGTVLRIRPVIEMIEGKLQLTHKERTNTACMEYFMAKCDEQHKKHAKVYCDVVAINCEPWGKRMVEAIKERYPQTEVHLTEYISPVFFVHLGDTGFGLAMAAE